jgi:hypothetical protein
MKAAFEIPIDGQASPQAALQDAKKSIVKGY